MNNLFIDYIIEKRKQIDKARHLKRMGEELYALSDSQLKIFNNTGYHQNPQTDITSLDRLHSELREDPAFLVLRRFSHNLSIAQNWYGINTNWEREKLDELATKLANRKLDQRSYESIKVGRGFNVFCEAEDIIKRMNLLKAEEEH